MGLAVWLFMALPMALCDNTTAILSRITTSPPPSSNATNQDGGAFCLSCGFNFGHILDGIDDKTAGLLMVVMVMVVLFGIGIVGACCLHDSCCGMGEYRHITKHPADEERSI